MYSDIIFIRLFFEQYSIAENSNMKKNDAKRASEASIDLYLRLYLEKHGPINVRAVVIEVKERLFEVVDLATRKCNRVYVDVS